MTDEVAVEKSVLRTRMLAARAGIDADARQRAADTICEIWRYGPLIDPPATVAGFWPIRGEFDPRPLMMLISGHGCELALPVVTGRGKALQFRAWRPGDRLIAGSFGTLEPDRQRAEVEPDLLLVPFLAVDRDGYRLGYGGGYYDRTLSAMRNKRAVQAVGLGFELQRVDAVPHGPADQRLDWLLTEVGAFAFV